LSNLPKFVDDDEDDSLAFKRWEDHVLKNYPNPQRIGCPDHETLRTFVETPRKVGVEELHGNHITRCAECARDLIELRRLREERLRQSAPVPVLSSWWGWKAAVAVASLCVMFVVVTVVWRTQFAGQKRSSQDGEIAEVTVDLSAEGVIRGSEGARADKVISLPRRLVDLHLILPYYSPAGEYRITVAQDRNSGPLRSQRTIGSAQGAHTELRVRLDLRGLSAGRYYLGTKHDDESTTYFYPFTVG